jgi:DNA-binding Lrp family transcriptional regulator
MDDPVLEFHVLEAVHKSDGKVTQRSISEVLGRSVASVNFALRLLAAKGFIKITGSNPRRLQYHLTPSGVIQKTILAYDFMKRQSALYDQVRKDLLAKLEALAESGVKRVAIYGWTPFTETAILYLVFEGIQVCAIYTDEPADLNQWNRIPFKSMDSYEHEMEVLLLMEPLSPKYKDSLEVRTLCCYPSS